MKKPDYLNTRVTVVGAGLAGSECAWQLAEIGFKVDLIEMRDGTKSTPAHKTDQFAELVCSNSFGSMSAWSAPAQLKWEAERMGSIILKEAKAAHIPAGQALGIDRIVFAQNVTQKLSNHPNITIHRRTVQSLSDIPRPAVIATGPLTDEALAFELREKLGSEFLYFFDAIAPVIDTDSIDMDICFKADRWGLGTGDYINCPMDKDQYFTFIEEITKARKIEPKEFEKNTPYFESCMPIEAMVERGPMTPRFGPMSGKGITDPRTGKFPFAVVQLRQENRDATAYNMVGFQTKMAYPEQKRVFQLIPGLQKAEFLKLGSIHRNLYINSPHVLDGFLSNKQDPGLFFAGQITGVEGYFESACMGLLVGRFLAKRLHGSELNEIDLPPSTTALGALLHTITDPARIKNFQPTNINFGLFPAAPESVKKDQKRAYIVSRAQTDLNQWLNLEQNISTAHTEVTL